MKFCTYSSKYISLDSLFKAAEKALKAAWFGRDARQVTAGHHLPSIASGLEKNLKQLAEELECLVGAHNSMLYPEARTSPKVPVDIYTSQMATEACEKTRAIIEFVSTANL